MLGCEGTERGEKRTVSVRLRPDRRTVSAERRFLRLVNVALVVLRVVLRVLRCSRRRTKRKERK